MQPPENDRNTTPCVCLGCAADVIASLLFYTMFCHVLYG